MSRGAEVDSGQVGWPDGMEMVRQAREAVGLFAGAMPITPQQAWEEALERMRQLATGRCAACMEHQYQPVSPLRRWLYKRYLYQRCRIAMREAKS